MKVTIIPIVISVLGTVTKKIDIIGNKRTSGNNLIEIGQNTEKSPGDLRRLVVTQIPVKDHQLMQM